MGDVVNFMRWKGGEPETLCGSGSTLRATVEIRKFLPDILASLECRVLVDAPCGDRNWIRHIDLPCDYIGVDYNPDHVQAALNDGVSAWRCDMRSDPLPPGDVIMCRDFFQHLNGADGYKAAKNVLRSGYRFILATCHGAAENVDIETGGFRPVNLELAPFFFPAPVAVFAEPHPQYPGRALKLYKGF